MRWFMWLLLVCIGCADQPHYDSHIDYPIATHYPGADGTDPDLRRVNPPGWGHFSASVTDDFAPSLAQVVRSVRRWEAAGACPVDVYNRMDRLHSDVGRLQVVNNVVIGHTLWTFFVGPHWKADGGPYVLVVSGRPDGASNNHSAYGDGGPLRLPDFAAKAGAAGHPFVLAFVNAGGREAQGNAPEVLQAVGEGIAFARSHFHIDDQRVVFAGMSRGGAAALMWGANPLGLPYRAAGIFAHAPPTDYAALCDQPEGTFPAMGRLFALVPEGDHADQLRILRDCLAGSQNPDTMRARSPVGQIVRFRDVYLAVGFGTHDPMIGPEQGFDFCQALDRAGVDYYAQFTLGGGHDPSQGVTEVFTRFVETLLKGDTPRDLPTRRDWNRAVVVGGKVRDEDLNTGSPVWSLFPRIATDWRDNAVYVGAPDGSAVYLRAATDDGTVWVERDTAVAWDYVRVHLPPPPKPGRYRWTITAATIELPDSAVAVQDRNGHPLPPETLASEKGRPSVDANAARAFGQAWVWPF